MTALWDMHVVDRLPAHVEVEWLLHNTFPHGAVSMLGGVGGVGKSVFVAALEVAVASGIPFLDSEVMQGSVLHFDFDTDVRLQGPWYQRVARGMNAPTSALSQIHYISPGDGDDEKKASPFLDTLRLESIAALVEEHSPALVVFDAWTSCFPYIRSNDAGEVAQVMAVMRSLAKSGPAVLILDHTPKPAPNGPSAIERGLLGSTLKMAGSRAVNLLSRVAPRDVGGRDVQRFDTVKNNLAPLGEGVGIERIWGSDGAVSFSVTDLPEGESHAPALERAMRSVREILDRQEMARKEVIKRIVLEANVSERTAASALARLVGSGELERTVQGREAVYRPVACLHTSDKHDGEGQESVQEGLHTSQGFAQVLPDRWWEI